MATTSTAGVVTTDYRVTSISEAGNDLVTVSFAEIQEPTANNVAQPYGSFTRTFSATDGAGFFPGQVYTLTLTKKS